MESNAGEVNGTGEGGDERYEPPTLTVLGSVAELTEGVGPKSDGTFGGSTLP